MKNGFDDQGIERGLTEALRKYQSCIGGASI